MMYKVTLWLDGEEWCGPVEADLLKDAMLTAKKNTAFKTGR
jgi:hypothetical protein